jgi:hypothetical protein
MEEPARSFVGAPPAFDTRATTPFTTRLRADRLRPLVTAVLNQPSYRQKAVQVGEKIRKVDGIRVAADIIERVLATGQPVTRGEVEAFKENSGRYESAPERV